MIIYRKSDLWQVGICDNEDDFILQVELNVLPNFGGVAEDYDYIETGPGRHVLYYDGNAIVQARPYELTTEEKKVELRPQRNSLMNEADLVYCNAKNWEQMTQEQKNAWNLWFDKMKNWVDIDLDNGIFPPMPINS